MSDESAAAKFFGNIIGIAIVLTIQALVGGVFRTEITVNLPAPANASVIPFEETWSATHWLGGFVTTDRHSVNDVIEKYNRPGTYVSKLTVTTKLTAMDSICSILTFMIYSPNTVIIKGELAEAPAKLESK